MATNSDVHLANDSLFRFYFQIATFFLVALAVVAEKKIELQDIEEDNLRSELKSEIEKDHDKSDGQKNSVPEAGLGYNSLDFMKTGLLKFFENAQTQPLHQQQQQRYVHQYAVTEQPERLAPVENKEQYEPRAPHQAMMGYLSNMPMQIYLVPHYSQPAAPAPQTFELAEFNSNGRLNTAMPNNYVEAAQPVTYIYQAQPTATPALATVQPILGFQVPVLHNPIPRLLAPTNVGQSYIARPEYRDTNTIDEHTSQTEIPQYTSTEPDYPRYYNSRAPIRGQYNNHGVPNLPHPTPLLLKAPPAHLAHVPRVLPMHRPYTKAVYQEGDIVSSSLAPRPYGGHGPFKRRPNSLLDSYVPSSVQIEYLKRGLAKDPSTLYDALASGRLPHTIPRHLERGFLPNQMYATAAGGVTYGHHKRNSKVERFPHK